MPYLKVNSITCEVAEESDKDEIYLIHKGKKVWPPNQKYLKIDVDEVLNIGLKVKIQKPGSLHLELWEYDLGSKDDHLGDFHLEVSKLEPGHHTELLIRNEKGAKQASYYMNWEVTD